MPHGDADTEPLAQGDSRAFAARACVTARQILWLESAAPILRYPAGGGAEASPATTRLVLANQIRAEITADNDVVAIDTATLLARSSPAALGEASLPIARRIAVALTKRDANRRQRWQQTREIDEVRAAHALKGLRDVVLFRPTAPVLVARPGQDPLPGVLGVLADAEGFELRTPLHDRCTRPLFERLKAYAFASGFGFREIALDRRLVAEAGPALHRRPGQDRRAARHGVPRTALARRRSRDARRDGGRRDPGGRPQAHGLHALRAAARQTQRPRHLALLDLRRARRHCAGC